MLGMFRKNDRTKSKTDAADERRISDNGRRYVYILGRPSKVNTFTEDMIEKLPVIQEDTIINMIHLDVQVSYLDSFNVYPNSSDEEMFQAWYSVLQLFIKASEEDEDHIILIGKMKPLFLEARRIFLERTAVQTVNDPEKYERIRKKLEIWVPIYRHVGQDPVFLRWAKI